jgi:hypothetical protein
LRRRPAFPLHRVASAACALACAVPAHAATTTASVTANAVKPLVLTKLQDLDLGSVTLGPGAWANAAVTLTKAGAFSCASANLVCTGVTSVATYNVQGSNHETIRISAPSVTLVNQSDSTQSLTLIPDAPPNVVLTSSGHPGNNFSIGGAITLSSTTAAGTYVGTFNVTVDY